MCSSVDEECWEKIDDFDFKLGDAPNDDISNKRTISIPIRLNNREFIVIPTRSSADNNDIFIYKYNIISNKWIKFIKIPNNYIITSHTAAIDHIHQLLYIYSNVLFDGKNLAIIDLKTKQFTFIKVESLGYDARSIMIRDEFHIIGGGRNNKHYVLDNKHNEFKSLYEFKLFPTALFQHGLLYIPSIDSLLLMGGYENGYDHETNLIFQYVIKNKIWKVIDITLPKELCAFGHVITNNAQYIVILGGDPNSKIIDLRLDEIYILDLKTMIFTESKIKCPVKGEFHSVIMNNFELNDFLTIGYIRDIWKTKEFENIVFIPNDIIKMINNWYCQEFIHLIQVESVINYHWRINVDDILSNLK